MVEFCGKFIVIRKRGGGRVMGVGKKKKKKKHMSFLPNPFPDLFFCFSFRGKIPLCGYTSILVFLLVSILFL